MAARMGRKKGQESATAGAESSPSRVEREGELRHEIEHRSISRIDDAVSARLQACCINFNDGIIRPSRRETAPWHDVNIPFAAATSDFTRRTPLHRNGLRKP